MDIDAYSDLVAGIYDCAVETDRWPEVLAVLRTVLAMHNAALDLYSIPGGRHIRTISSGLSDEDRAAQAHLMDRAPDLWGGWRYMASVPIDKPFLVSRLLSPEQIAASPYYREWAAPRGLIDSLLIVLARDSSLFGSIVFARHAREGPISSANLALARRLTPHLQRAARINGLLDDLRQTTQDFRTLIGNLSAPVFLIGAEGEIVEMNSAGAAYLRDGGVLTVQSGRLATSFLELQSVLDGLLTPRDLGPNLSGQALAIRGPDGGIHTFHPLPLRSGRARASLAGKAVAAIFVTSAQADLAAASQILSREFALTPGEQRVFTVVAQGFSTREAAHVLGVGVGTVRTHLHRIFAKTGLTRQADLIALAQGMNPPPWRTGTPGDKGPAS